MAGTKPGTSVKFTLIREGQQMQITVSLGERPKELQAKGQQEKAPQEQNYQKLGLSVQTLTPDIAGQLGYKNVMGVVVADVASGSPAEDAGLQEGDLIMEVNGVKVHTDADFKSAISRIKSGDSAALLVRRDDSTFFVPIQMP